MEHDLQALELPHLVWVNPDRLSDTLDSATWLEPTRELRKVGWRVSLIAAGPAGRRYIQGVEVRCVPKPQIYFVRQVVFHLRLLHLLLREWTMVDAILFHQMSLLWILLLKPLRLVFRGHRPVFVMDTRTVPMETGDRATLRDSVRGAFQSLMNWMANRWVDGQTAITLRMADAVKIPKKKLWGTWPSGVNLGMFSSAQLTRQWPVRQEPIRLIYVGVLHYERNLMALCHAVARANAEGMSYTLSLVGDGTERAALQDFARQSQGSVSVVLPVAHDQVPGLLSTAHVGVLPFPDRAKYRVSSPIKLFEYMAAGLPILATRIVCHTDVIAHGQFVFWAQDASVEGLLEALCQIWQSRSSLDAMGYAAAAAAQEWTWEASAHKLKAALEYGFAQNQHHS